MKNTVGAVIVYHNVRSLTLYLEDIKTDDWYSRAHVLILSETRMKGSERIVIPTYQIQYSSDENPTTGQRGLMCLAKENIDFKLLERKILTEKKRTVDGRYKGHVEMIAVQLKNIYLITGYKSPGASISTFFDVVDGMIAKLTGNYTQILMGNFNINIANMEDSANFKVKIEHRHLKTTLINEIYTTDMNTQIDIICTDTKKYLAGVYDSYFSDHKPVFIEVEDCFETLPVINILK